MRNALHALAGLFLLMLPAQAAESPRELYTRGDYAAAIAAAEADPTAENLALAARAALGDANLRARRASNACGRAKRSPSAPSKPTVPARNPMSCSRSPSATRPGCSGKVRAQLGNFAGRAGMRCRPR